MTSSASLEALLGQDEPLGAPDRGTRRRVNALSFASLLCGIVLVALGLVVLIGWLLNVEQLMAILPGYVRMKPGTAIGFAAAGSALVLARLTSSPAGQGSMARWASVGTRCLAALSGTCGALTLVEYVFKVDLHIDELLFADPSQWPYPGRMAHITAINFCLAGTALWMMQAGRRARRLVPWLALVLAGGAYAGIVGYLYGVPVFYGSLGYTAMAFHTGLGFLVLGSGILVGQSESPPVEMLCADEPGSWLARRMLPVVIVLPVVLGWSYLQPAISFERPRFAMALFAVTLVGASSAALWFTASFLNQAERERREGALIRERSAAAVDQSERELRLVTDSLPILISYIDKEGRFLRVNRTYEGWLGLPASKIVGRSIKEVLGEEYRNRIEPAWEAAFRGDTSVLETAYPTVRGDRRTQVTYSPDIDVAGEVRGVACMVVDIEEHRLAESALRQSEKLAVVGRLASSISHEINNPLEAVTNLLYLLELETETQKVAHDYVVQAQQELARVTNIVVQTLRFHRQATHPTLCQVSTLMEQVLALYSAKLVNAHVVVASRFRETSGLLCREGEVRQVLANLVGNGVDAMSDGGRLLVRTCTAVNHRTGQSGVVVTVADTGHGIPPGLRATMFEPFHTTKGAKGSGLGLWISKEIVDRHQGVVSIRSSRTEGASGTVFRMFFPYTV